MLDRNSSDLIAKVFLDSSVIEVHYIYNILFLVAPSGRIVPLSERQQMALLKKIEEQRKQSASPKPDNAQVSTRVDFFSITDGLELSCCGFLRYLAF